MAELSMEVQCASCGDHPGPSSSKGKGKAVSFAPQSGHSGGSRASGKPKLASVPEDEITPAEPGPSSPSSIVSLAEDIDMPLTATIEIAVVGLQFVGKTAMIAKFLDRNYNLQHQPPIIGERPMQVKGLVKENKRYNLMIKDVTGAVLNLYPNCHFLQEMQGVILTFDLTKRGTFTGVEGWWRHANLVFPEMPFCVVVGNKCDQAQEREVTPEEGEQLAQRLGGLFFCETSAMTGEHIRRPFVGLLRRIVPTLGPLEIEDND
ncbi:hypothetical protein VTJ49DRAFT_5115 [Mycothermus thermophilus]|uniref:Uncharacterized protein n=1 Tax=Humicola insolens TaxID=85995 RepID=A0ABR3VL23_HUMIN